MKTIGFLILWNISFFLSAQTYSEILPPDNIKTIQLFNPQTNDQSPIISIDGEYLILSFDDLNAGFQEYSYKIEHYNADWTPSGIFQSEYLNGYASNYIRDYKNSFNTYQTYTNYRVSIPNQNSQIKLPGNYVVSVMERDSDKPIFSRRFAIYERNKVNMGMQVERAIGSGDLNQRVSAVVTSGQMDLTQSPDGAKLFIMKNNNWNDKLVIDRPQFMKSSQLTYQNQNTVFEGNSEYLWFDTKTLEVASLNTERIFRQDSLYHTVLRVDLPRNNLSYFDDPDVNGAFYIRNARLSDQTLSYSQADYTWVYFALDEFDDKGGSKELYVVGAFNNWNLSPEYQLHKGESGYWEVAILLKQGYYNYQYAVYDTTIETASLSTINGSYWQTENSYQGLFYFRPWGTRYDVLMGFGEVNTRN